MFLIMALQLLVLQECDLGGRRSSPSVNASPYPCDLVVFLVTVEYAHTEEIIFGFLWLHLLQETMRKLVFKKQ